ncbi:MAG: PIN domain-containing protein [Gemmatimonadetes bacterium]|nr:PIN domain-containing protein [Gemmatimonadota bacterium]
MLRVAIDTNVVVAAARSNQGASHRLLRLIGPEAPFQVTLSVPLALEYEMALKRRTDLDDEAAEAIVDYLCQVADRREIYFLWRPFLKAPADEMVLEVAVGGGVQCIVTHNLADFEGVQEQFGIRVTTPGAFMMELEGKTT